MKKTLKRISLLLLCALIAVPLGACNKRQKKHTASYFGYFDSFAEFTLYTDSEERFEHYSDIVERELKKYHEMLDAYNGYDGKINIYSLNEGAANTPMKPEPELFAFLKRAKELYDLTDGYTSVTLGAVTAIWKEAIKNGVPPSEESLRTAAEHTDINDLLLDSENWTVAFADEQLKLDAGALGKGFAADCISDMLCLEGCKEPFMLNIGGTLAARKEKPDGTPWQAGIQAPNGGELDGVSVNLSRIEYGTNALSTSGSYHRCFEYGGVLYHHIINPYTLMPENNFTSVSVNCYSSTRADALSTALFSMTLEEGQALIDSLKDAEAVWLLADGNVIKSNGIE